MSESERVKVSMTMTPETEAWLEQTYPDGLEIQEQLRMAVSDARQIRGDE